MSVDQWDFGVRPELKLTKFVIIDGVRFDLKNVLEVLTALGDADAMFNPVVIYDNDLAQALMTEGLCFPNTKGSYGGTQLIPEVLVKLEALYHLDSEEVGNPQLKYVYMDTTTFDHEMGHTAATTYPTEESVKVSEPCANDKECGIVRVVAYAIEAVQWPQSTPGK